MDRYLYFCSFWCSQLTMFLYVSVSCLRSLSLFSPTHNLQVLDPMQDRSNDLLVLPRPIDMLFSIDSHFSVSWTIHVNYGSSKRTYHLFLSSLEILVSLVMPRARRASVSDGQANGNSGDQPHSSPPRSGKLPRLSARSASSSKGRPLTSELQIIISKYFIQLSLQM